MTTGTTMGGPSVRDLDLRDTTLLIKGEGLGEVLASICPRPGGACVAHVFMPDRARGWQHASRDDTDAVALLQDIFPGTMAVQVSPRGHDVSEMRDLARDVLAETGMELLVHVKEARSLPPQCSIDPRFSDEWLVHRRPRTRDGRSRT